MMRRIPLFTLLAVLAVLPSFGQAPPLNRMDVVMKSVPNGPVAKVRGVNIPRSVFVKFYQGELARITMRKDAPLTMEARAELGLYCLRVLVQQELLYQQAQANKLRVSDQEVKEAWAREKVELRKRAERVKGGEVTDDQVLEMAGYRNEEEILAEVRRSMMIEKMARKVLEDAGVSVDDSQIREFYESRKEGFARPDMLHLQQIFFRAEAGKSPRAIKEREDARMRAEDVLKRVRSGQSFDGLVRRYSDGSKKDEGGHAGPLPLKAFPPFMVDAALQLDPGGVSGILESDYGYHIIKLVEFSPGEQAELDDAKDTIKRVLEGREEERAIAEYCEELLKDPGDLQIYLEIEKNLSYLTE